MPKLIRIVKTVVPPPDRLEPFLDACLHALRGGFGERLVSVVLFGSLARGGYDPETSDVDLLIVCDDLPGDARLRHEQFHAALGDLGGLRPRLEREGCFVQFSPLLKTRDEATYHSPIYLDMVEDARILHDREDFFAGVLVGLRKRLGELGSRRVWLEDGSWYWDLKPDYRFGEVFEV